MTGSFTDGTVLSASALNNAINSFTLNTQTGTTYAPVLADAGKLVTLTNAAAITVTVPTNATVAFPVGTRISFANLGAGLVTFAGAGGVTITGPLTLTQNSTLTLVKVATDTWLAAAGGFPKVSASGGTESNITDPTDALDYHLHVWTATTGTLVVTTAGQCEIEIRAAGGSSGGGTGSWSGSAGGAGGYLRMVLWLPVGTYNITAPAGTTASESTKGNPAMVSGPMGTRLWVPGGGYGGNNNGSSGIGASNGGWNTGTPECNGTYGNAASGSSAAAGGAGGTNGAGKTTTFRGTSETVCIGGSGPSNPGTAPAGSGNGGNSVPTNTTFKPGASGSVGIRYQR